MFGTDYSAISQSRVRAQLGLQCRSLLADLDRCEWIISEFEIEGMEYWNWRHGISVFNLKMTSEMHVIVEDVLLHTFYDSCSLCVIPPSVFNVFNLTTLLNVAKLVWAKTNFRLIVVIATDHTVFWIEFECLVRLWFRLFWGCPPSPLPPTPLQIFSLFSAFWRCWILLGKGKILTGIEEY